MASPETLAMSMRPVPALPETYQDRLAQILDAYLTSAEQGTPTDPDELLSRYPDDADYLRPYLIGLQRFHTAVTPRTAALIRSEWNSQRAAEVLGDFRIVAEIGRGGMGVVYEAMQLSLNRRVALKVLTIATGHNETQIQRFQNEARAAATAQHPNIVPVYAIDNDRSVHFYAMQLIDGRSLASSLALQRASDTESMYGASPPALTRPIARNTSHAPNPIRTREHGQTRKHDAQERHTTNHLSQTNDDIRSIASLGIQAANALHAAHEYGVIHRDVKPSNLLIDEQGKLWVTDFGLALCKDNRGLTQTGDILGTMRYMSPEQASGQGNVVDHRTDIYSLGVTLYELATLHHPAGEASDLQLFANRDRLQQQPLRHWRSNIPLDFQTIVMKAIAEAPSQRYATARQLAEDLQRFLDGQPIIASRPSQWDRASKWARRHRGLVRAMAAIFVVALAGQTVNSWLLAKKHYEKEQALVTAQDNLQQALTVLDRFGNRLVDQLAAIPGAEGVRYQLLEDSLRLYEQFASQASGQHELEADLARAYGKIGRLSEKLGDKEHALQKHQAARAMWQSRLAALPAGSEAKRQLALCCNNVGLLLAEHEQFDEALAELRMAVTLQRQLLADQPHRSEIAAELVVTRNNLGHTHRQLGQTGQAIDQFHAAIELGEALATTLEHNEHALRGLAASYHNLGSTISATNRDASAEALQHAVELQRRLVKSQPINRIYQGDLARTYDNLGALFAMAESWDRAEIAYLNAVQLQEKLVVASPLAMSYRRDLAISYNNLGMAESRQQRLSDAVVSFQAALKTQQLIVTAAPTDGKALSHLGTVWNNLGLLYEQQQAFVKAEDAFVQAIHFQQQASTTKPLPASRRDLLSNHYANYASCLRKQNKRLAAEQIERKRDTWLAGNQ